MVPSNLKFFCRYRLGFGFADNWDPKPEIQMHGVCWICLTHFAEEEDESNSASKPKFFAWDSSAYGHVCAWINCKCYWDT